MQFGGLIARHLKTYLLLGDDRLMPFQLHAILQHCRSIISTRQLRFGFQLEGSSLQCSMSAVKVATVHMRDSLVHDFCMAALAGMLAVLVVDLGGINVEHQALLA
jgi:hypothetical protein